MNLDDLAWVDRLGGAYECLFDLQLASIYRKYKALSLGNPCQRHYWIMRSYRARLTEVKLLRMGGSHV